MAADIRKARGFQETSLTPRTNSGEKGNSSARNDRPRDYRDDSRKRRCQGVVCVKIGRWRGDTAREKTKKSDTLDRLKTDKTVTCKPSVHCIGNSPSRWEMDARAISESNLRRARKYDVRSLHSDSTEEEPRGWNQLCGLITELSRSALHLKPREYVLERLNKPIRFATQQMCCLVQSYAQEFVRGADMTMVAMTSALKDLNAVETMSTHDIVVLPRTRELQSLLASSRALREQLTKAAHVKHLPNWQRADQQDEILLAPTKQRTEQGSRKRRRTFTPLPLDRLRRRRKREVGSCQEMTQDHF